MASEQKQDVHSYDVVIIGGGVAGITATSVLSKQGIKCCLIEATNALGGRAKSENWGSNDHPLFIDFGCQWIHYTDSTKHPFIDDAKSMYGIDLFKEFNGIRVDDGQTQGNSSNNWIIYDMTTQKCFSSDLYSEITDDLIGHLEDEILTESYRDEMKKNKEKYPKKDYSLKELFMDKYNASMVTNIEENCKKIAVKLKTNDFDIGFMQRCMDWAIAWFEDYESLLDDESYYTFFDDLQQFGDDLLMNGQFGLFVQMIAERGIDTKHAKIALNTICKSVQYEMSKDCMKVTAVNNEQQSVEYECKHVIIALSVGCLQKRSIKIQNLKKSVWNVIDAGWGSVNSQKMIIEFADQFKEKNDIKRLSILSPQKLYNLNDDENENKEDSEYVPGMHQKYSMCRRYNDASRNVWNVFLTPRYSEKLRLMALENEKLDEMVLKDVLVPFGNVFGDLPKVKKYKMTHWDSDKFFNGSWVYWKKDGNGAKDCAFVQNLGNDKLFDCKMKNGYNHNILFAGDWTQSGYGCCSHAHESGKRVAKQVMMSGSDSQKSKK